MTSSTDSPQLLRSRVIHQLRSRWWLLLCLIPLGMLGWKLAAREYWNRPFGKISDDCSTLLRTEFSITYNSNGLVANAFQKTSRLDLRTGQNATLSGWTVNDLYAPANVQKLLVNQQKNLRTGTEEVLFALVHPSDLSIEQVILPDDLPELRRIPYLPPLLRTVFLDDTHVCFFGQRSCVWMDVSTTERRHLPYAEDISLTTEQIITELGPGRVLAWERSPAANSPPVFTLLAITENEIQGLGTWKAKAGALEPPWFDKKEFVYSFSEDGMTLEKHSLTTGELVKSLPIDALLDATANGARIATTKGADVYLTDSALRATFVINVEENRITHPPVEGIFYPNAISPDGNRWLGRDATRLLVWDIALQKLFPLDTPLSPLIDKSFTPDGEQVIFAYKTGPVRFVDVKSGKVVRTINGDAWVAPAFIGLWIGFAVWMALWVRVSVQQRTPVLLDLMLWNGFILTALVLRVLLTESREDPGRMPFQFAQGLLGSWVVMTMLATVMGNARWTLRMVFPIAVTAAGLAISQLMYRGSSQNVFELAVGGAGIVILCGLCFAALRWFGGRLEWQSSAPLPGQAATSGTSRRFSIRDLFLLTTLCACLMATLRLTSPYLLKANQVAQIATLSSLMIGSSVLAVWLALGTRFRVVRILILGMMLVVGGTVLVVQYPTHNYQLLSNVLEWFDKKSPSGYLWTSGQVGFRIFAGLFTFASLLIYRAHGLRLVRRS